MNTRVVCKPWGREYCCYQNSEVAIWVLEINKGEATSLHCHPNKNTALIILQGIVELSFIRGTPKIFIGLDKINIFRGRFHRTGAISNDVVLLEVETPENKTDIIRLEDDYGRAGKPIEMESGPIDDSCLQLKDTGIEQYLAKRSLRVITSSNSDALCWQDDKNIFVTLHGGLIHGLLPPGDAIDGATMEKLIQHGFHPLPNSKFLLIQQWSIP